MIKKMMGLMLLTNVLISLSSTTMAEEFVQTDRYTLSKVDARGDQKAPLTAVVTLTFGTDIRTVGDAITELLNGSGYRWEKHDDDASLSSLPLPSVVRTLGPVRINEALSIVAGQAWSLRVDERRRMVWFDVNDSTASDLN